MYSDGGEADAILLMLAMVHQIGCGNWRSLVTSGKVESIIISVIVVKELC